MEEYKNAWLLNQKVLVSYHTKFLLEFAVERGYITNTCNCIKICKNICLSWKIQINCNQI